MTLLNYVFLFLYDKSCYKVKKSGKVLLKYKFGKKCTKLLKIMEVFGLIEKWKRGNLVQHHAWVRLCFLLLDRCNIEIHILALFVILCCSVTKKHLNSKLCVFVILIIIVMQTCYNVCYLIFCFTSNMRLM